MVASRNEIERVNSELSAVAVELGANIMALLPDPIQRVQVDAALPEIDYRITKTRHALTQAAESYFSADARLAHHIESIGHAVKNHPWLWHLLPSGARSALIAGGGIALVGAQFALGNLGAEATRLTASTIDEKGIASRIANHQPLTMTAVPTNDYPAARSLTDIGSRLDELNRTQDQIRIETYLNPAGEKTLLVYLPGTQSLNPFGGHNAFDVNTDAQLATSPQTTPIVHAVAEAIHKAGGTNSHVLLVGYSLGGIVAGEIAASKQFDVTGVITIGSPVGQLHMPSHVPVLSIQHNNDPVPAATGATNPLTSNWATASKEFVLRPGESTISAHKLESYEQTLVEVDDSKIAGVSRIRDLILSQIQGSPTAQNYAITRGAY